MAKNKKLRIPQSALGRVSKLALASVSALSKELSRHPKDSEKHHLQKRVAQAQTMVDALSQLKGAAMKTGQILSLEFSDILPPEVTKVLSQLHDESRFLPIADIRKILMRQLGQERFAAIKNLSEEPIAAASIGQVHRATIHDQDVAIKIQYPGVEKTLGADLKTLQQIIRPIVWARGQKVDLQPFFDEIEKTLRQEVDYAKEANYLMKYQNHIGENQVFRAPSLNKGFSTKRVLTMSFERGLRIKDWLATNPAESEREIFGENILNLLFHEFFVWGFVQTDPNYGNFLYRPEQHQIILLDFGACKSYPRELRRNITKLLGFAIDQDHPNLIDLSHRMGVLSKQEGPKATKLYTEMMDLLGQMFLDELQPFDFGDLDYINELRASAVAFINAVRQTEPAHQLIFLNRKLGGMFHLLKDLQVKLDLSILWKQAKSKC